MKRILSSLVCALILLAGGMGVYVPVAQAQTDQVFTDPASGAVIGTVKVADSPTTPPPSPANDASYDFVMSKLMGLFAWLVGAAAITLDNAVFYTIVKMGSFADPGTGLSAIGVTWRILRDVGNIILIFGFIAMGIAVIIEADWYGSGTKFLPKLLIAAVFVNFSLFISGAVVSAGNLFATQFYTQINAGQPAGQKNLSFDGVHNEGISNKLMAQLGLQTLYNVNFAQNKAIFSAGNMWIVGFMAILLFLVAAFVMFSLAFILIARFVALVFIIIIAPIGFVGLAVPKLEEYAQQWWSQLIEQTITAPVLLLMLYVALRVITDVQFLSDFGVPSKASWLDVMTGNTAGTVAAAGAALNNGQSVSSLAGLLLSFLIAMGLLLVVTVLAKKLSAFGAGWATGLASKATFGLTSATLGFAGRNSLGWGSTRLANRLRGSAFARRSFVGRGLVSGLDRGSKASFDFRNAATIKSAGGIGFVKDAGVAFGAGTKGGYADWEKKKIEDRTKYAATLRQTKEEEHQQEVEESRAKRMTESLDAVQKFNTSEMKKLADDQAEAMRPIVKEFREATDSFTKISKEYEAAKKSNSLTQELEVANTKAKARLDEATAKRTETLAAQSKQREELETIHTESVKVQREELALRQKNVQDLKNAPKEGYAKSMEFGLSKDGFFNKWINVNRNTAAAKKIRSEFKKSKDEKNLEALKELIKENGKEEKKKEEGEGGH